MKRAKKWAALAAFLFVLPSCLFEDDTTKILADGDELREIVHAQAALTEAAMIAPMGDGQRAEMQAATDQNRERADAVYVRLEAFAVELGDVDWAKAYERARKALDERDE